MSVVTVTVKSEGSVVPGSHALLSVDVRAELDRLPSAVLLYADGDAAERSFALGDATLFDIGRRVEILARYEEGSSGDATLFDGLVVRQALEAGASGSVLRIELRHPAVRMTARRRSQVFRDKKDSDVWSTLAGDASLQISADATTVQHPVLVQFDCSDWDFLLSRADANGRHVACLPGKLRVAKRPQGAAAALSLDYGLSTVYALEFECDATGQNDGFKARSWDPKNQAAVEAPASPAQPQPDLGALSGTSAAGKLGSGERLLQLPAHLDKPEIGAWAGSLAARAALSLVRGRASLPGTTQAGLLDTVEVDGVPRRFAGQALVSGLCHRIDESGWVTDLQFGLSPQPFHQRPDIAPPPAAGLLPPARGLQIGVVKKVHEDPLSEFRIEVALPGFGGEAEGVWARIAMPEAGKDRGLRFMPEPGDEVVVGFFGDDPRAPVVLGALYSSKNTPPTAVSDDSADNTLRGLVSRSGLVIGLLDEGDKPKLFLKTPGGQTLTLDDDAQSVAVEDQHGNRLCMDKNGITLDSAKDLVFKAQGEVKLEAQGAVAVKGSKVDLQ